MSNDIWEMKRAINDAEQTLRDADKVARSIAPLLIGRLKNCSCDDLKKLKKELKYFNMHTYTWKE